MATTGKFLNLIRPISGSKTRNVGSTLKESTAISRIAAQLGPFVTNAIIDALAADMGFRPLQASNKVAKIRLILEMLQGDGRTRSGAAKVISQLVVEAHHRTVSGAAQMTESGVDSIVADMKVLGLPTGELARSQWRSGLKSASPMSSIPEAPSLARSNPTNPLCCRHVEALQYISQLANNNGYPQNRGRELEKILTDVLRKEGLGATRNIVNPGEQIDAAFVLDGQHYLVECKWECEPVGAPALREFSEKVRRKAEGTFGLILSMSGFVKNINSVAAIGSRLNCIGIAHQELISVLEGRTTMAATVRSARAAASTKSCFYLDSGA